MSKAARLSRSPNLPPPIKDIDMAAPFRWPPTGPVLWDTERTPAPGKKGGGGAECYREAGDRKGEVIAPPKTYGLISYILHCYGQTLWAARKGASHGWPASSDSNLVGHFVSAVSPMSSG